MSRLVLDTNVVVSAFLTQRGNESRVLRLALSDKHELFVSDAILDEYQRVPESAKVQVSTSPTSQPFSPVVVRQAAYVAPKTQLQVAADDADNRFLECGRGSLRALPRHRQQEAFPTRMEADRCCEWTRMA